MDLEFEYLVAMAPPQTGNLSSCTARILLILGTPTDVGTSLPIDLYIFFRCSTFAQDNKEYIGKLSLSPEVKKSDGKFSKSIFSLPHTFKQRVLAIGLLQFLTCTSTLSCNLQIFVWIFNSSSSISHFLFRKYNFKIAKFYVCGRLVNMCA